MRILPILLLAALTAPPLHAVTIDELPKRKSGLWEIKTSSPAIKEEARMIHMCVDQKADDLTGQAAARAKELCSKTDIKKDTGRVTIDSVCKFGHSTATTRSVITGNFDSAYHVETSSTYDPPMGGQKQMSAIIDARWLGPCKADQRPGDVILGNGARINILDGPRGSINPPRPKPQE